MRIVQIIDSLDIGGAEKMAVNYANALSDKIDFSGLVTTRAEGDLKTQINNEVNYLYLKKKAIIDISACIRLKKFCKAHDIDFLHCHSSSYFIAVLTKMIYPKLKIIWHDHNGLSEFITSQKNHILKAASCFFSGIIVVNYQLKDWAENYLHCKNVIYLPNFTELNGAVPPVTFLYGNQGKRIVCLANLRPQKNHFLLLEVAQKCKEIDPEWTFHLIGKDFEDEYSTKVKEAIVERKLQHTVYIYGAKNDIKNIISQCDIAIFTSDSEGLPVALIEFGLLKKPVLSTKVGEIPLIINHNTNGFIVKVNEPNEFFEYLKKLIDNEVLRTNFGAALYETIRKNNSKNGVIEKYLTWLLVNGN